MSSTYTNLATTVPIARDEGILKRVMATPLPRPVYIGGRIMSATWFVFLGAVIMLVVAVLVLRRPGRDPPCPLHGGDACFWARSACARWAGRRLARGRAATPVRRWPT